MERDLHEEKEITTLMSKSTHLNLEVTSAALFGVICLALSAFLIQIRLKIPVLDIAIIDLDPVSIFWIKCFLIFGPKSGIL